MNFLMRFLNFFGRVLLPARLRPTAIASRLQMALDKSAASLEKGAGKAAERMEAGPAHKTGQIFAFFRWFLHFALIGGILVLLYFVNRWLGLERVLRSDWPVLHPYWLPALFMLLYFMAWLGWWIWELTGPEKLTHEFPDIDQAWKEGQKNVADAGIDLRDAPVFLVIGRPLEGEDNVMLGSHFGFKVREVPRWPDAPLHFSAGDQGVFISAAGASVMGRQITLMVEEIQENVARREVRPEAAGDVHAAAVAPIQAAPMPAAESTQATLETSGQMPDAVASATTTTDEEQRVIGLLEAEVQADKPAVATRRRAFLKNKMQVQEAMARLQHVCHLLSHNRLPYCPINGIVVLLPFAATDNDEDAAQAATACELDLTVVYETLQVRCPVFVIGCDAEMLPGFHEFLQRMPASQRDRRMGQRFPLTPDVQPGELPDVVQSGVGWFTHTFLPAPIYNLFRVEMSTNGHLHSPGAEMPEAIVGNLRLYQFWNELRQRRKRLTRFLTRGLLLEGAAPFFFGGFYVAGTGPDAERDQGFVAGVFQRLPENQNIVVWTPEALDQEADFKRWTRYGYTLFALALAALGVLVYRLWLQG